VLRRVIRYFLGSHTLVAYTRNRGSRVLGDINASMDKAKRLSKPDFLGGACT
jgi:hypothetical protein